eukprot:scaffold249353_cov82-Cyclotella_meneghiniana.AAC.24
MDSNLPNRVQQFNDILSRCKAEMGSDDLSYTISIHLTVGTHAYKKSYSPELQGQRKAFNIEEESVYSSFASAIYVDEVFKQARADVCKKVVEKIFQFFPQLKINRPVDYRSQLKLSCDKVTEESMDTAFMETIQLEIQVNKNILCRYNEKDCILLKKGDKFQPSCFDVLKDAKNKTFGLAYDEVKNNLGPIYHALQRGPKTFNTEDTFASFVHYLEVVGSDGEKEREECFNCFGQISLPERYNEDKIIYLPLELKQLCQKAGMNLNNIITVEEVASEVKACNETLYREMSVIFKPGASNNKSQKIVPFPDNVRSIPKRSPDVYPPPHVPKIEDLRKHLPFEICSDEDWTIVTINSAQQMIDIGNSKFIESKVLGIDFEADHDHLTLMSVTNYGPDRRIFVLDLISNEVRENFPSVFGKMLEDSKILKIGHSLRSLDRPKLLHELDCMMVGMYDTQIVYKLLSQNETIGLERVLSMYEIPKPANRNTNTKKAYQLWNWCKRPIDKDALNYAAMDVAHLAAIMTIQFEKHPKVIPGVLIQSNKAL